MSFAQQFALFKSECCSPREGSGLHPVRDIEIRYLEVLLQSPRGERIASSKLRKMINGARRTLQSPRGERIASVSQVTGLDVYMLQSPRGERIASRKLCANIALTMLQSPRGERIASDTDAGHFQKKSGLQSPRGERIASCLCRSLRWNASRCSPREGSGLHHNPATGERETFIELQSPRGERIASSHKDKHNIWTPVAVPERGADCIHSR